MKKLVDRQGRTLVSFSSPSSRKFHPELTWQEISALDSYLDGVGPIPDGVKEEACTLTDWARTEFGVDPTLPTLGYVTLHLAEPLKLYRVTVRVKD